MRTLKTLGLLLVVATLGVSLASCEKDEYESRIKELIIKNEVRMGSSGSTDTQTFRNEDLSNYAVASSDPTWCTAAIDKQTSTITVTAAENTTYGERQATITISDIHIPTMTRTFTVIQAQNDALIIDDSQKQFNVEMEGGQVAVALKSNVNFDVEIPDEYKEWIAIGKAEAKTRALKDSTIVLDIAKNNSGSTREGKVYIVNKSNNDRTTITINQAFKVVFAIDPASIELDELGGEISVKVNANIAVDVYCDDDWVTEGLIETIDDDNFVRKFHVKPFTDKRRSRTTKITFENAAFQIYDRTVTVTQVRKLYIVENSISLTEGERLAVELRNSTDGEVTWTTSNDKVATVTKDGTIVGVSQGRATITVKSADGKYSDTVTVNVNTASEAKITSQWVPVMNADGLVSSVTITLTNSDENPVYLGNATLYRVITDVAQTSTVTVGTVEGDFTNFIDPGYSIQFPFNGIAPESPSETATYSYYLTLQYRYAGQTFTYRTSL